MKILKILKKALSLVVALSLLLSLVVTNAAATNPIEVSIDGSSSAETGKTFTTDLKLVNSDSTSVGAITVYVYYDPSVLNCTNVVPDDVFDTAEVAPAVTLPSQHPNYKEGYSVATFVWSKRAGTTISGKLATLTFSVANDLESTNTSLLLDFVEITDTTVGNPVKLDVNKTNGSVSITGVTPTITAVTFDETAATTQTINVTGTIGGSAQMMAASAKGTNITTGVTWSVFPSDGGVSINANGAVTVDPKAVAQNYTISANAKSGSSQGGPVSATLTVTRAPSVAASMKIFKTVNSTKTEIKGEGNTLSDSIVIPKSSDANKATYSARVLDQFGAELEDATISIEKKSTNSNVSIEGTDTISVAQGASKETGAFVVTATSQTDTETTSQKLVKVVNVSTVEIGFKDIVVDKKPDPTYGDTWREIVRSVSGTVTLGTEEQTGVEFTLLNSTIIPEHGEQTFQATYSGTIGGTTYSNVLVELGEAGKITIGQRDINLVTTTKVDDVTYTGASHRPTPTVTDTVGGQNLIKSTDYEFTYGTNIEVGTGTVTVQAKPGGNYTGTKALTFAIGKATLTLAPAVGTVPTILASDSNNATAEALAEYVKEKAGRLFTGIYAGKNGNETIVLTPTWNLKSGTWSEKGGAYIYKADLAADSTSIDLEKNFNAIIPPEASVKVVAVYADIVPTTAGMIVSKNTAANITALADLGLPTTATVTYRAAEEVTGATLPTQETKTITWKETVDTVKSAANGVTSENVNVNLTPVASGLSNWTSDGSVTPFVLTITPKKVATATGKPTIAAEITYSGTGVDATIGADVTVKDENDTAITTGITWTFSYAGRDGTDYGPSVSAPLNVGKYTVTAVADTDDYRSNGISADFEIKPKDITNEAGITVALDPADQTFTYNGNEHKPTVKVTGLEAADYKVTYDHNVDAAKSDAVSNPPTITVTGQGNYKGTKTLTFTINPLDLSGEGVTTVNGLLDSYDFTGAAITPNFSVNVKGIATALVKNTDYTVAYADNTGATTPEAPAKITITGTGNYTGEVVKTFQISKVVLIGSVTIEVTQGSEPGNDAAKVDAGDTLTAKVQLSEKDTSKLTYQWKKNGEDITTGANSGTYTLPEDVKSGDKFTVVVSTDSTSGYSGSVTSNEVAVDEKPMPAATVTFTAAAQATNFLLTATVRYTPTSDLTLADFKANFFIQWYRDGVAITFSSGSASQNMVNLLDAAPAAEETITDLEGSTYTTTDADKGHVITSALVPKPNSGYNGKVVAGSTAVADMTTSSTSDKGSLDNNGIFTFSASKPAKPTAQVTAGNGKVTVTPSTTDGGSKIISWTVSWTWSGGSDTKVFTGNGPFEITGLTNNIEYTFKVTATNSLGDSDPSEGVPATPKASVGPVTPSRPGSGDSSSSDDRDSVTIRSSSSDHGSIRLSSRDPKKGDTVTITIKPDRGYEVDRVTVTTSSGRTVDVRDIGGNEYTFVMPSGTVKVNVTYRLISAQTPETFTDVPSTYWAADAIQWVNENGYMMGNSSITFNPEGRITRQQMWMIMARMAGANPADFSAAKAWAIANNISDGSAPGNSVTRQQMVTILYRYAQMMGFSTSGGTDLTAYPDNGSVASYAQEALRWSVGNSIVGGTTDGRLNPGGTATRAQFATILQRFYTNVAG